MSLKINVWSDFSFSRLSGCSALEPVKRHSGTLRPLLSVLLMSSLMLLR